MSVLKPGLHANVLELDYLGQLPEWRLPSQSVLKVMADRTPAHGKQKLDHPDTRDTEARALGRAIHSAVLQPDIFITRYLKGPDGNWSHKEPKDIVKELRENNPAATVLKPNAWNLCDTARAKVWAKKKAKNLLTGALLEQSAVWAEEVTGVLYKARYDALNSKLGIGADLKSTASARKADFSRDIFKYGWYLQGAHYRMGARILGVDVAHFVIIAFEKDPPHEVALYRLQDDLLRAGEAELSKLYDTWAACERRGHWPGYEDEVLPIGVPTWAWAEIDERTLA